MLDEKRDSLKEIDRKSLENGGSKEAPITSSNPHYEFDVHDLDQVQRRLKQRHVQMIAIAGTIGTGLFLGSGGALANAGPLGALLSYALVGTVAYSSLCSVGEMSTWAPISGTFPHFAARWVDPALGFAIGWNYFYTNAISTPVEITAAVILLTFWDHDAPTSHIAGYTLVLRVLVCLINIFGVRYFGESEFIFAILKLTLIIGLIFVGLIIDLGGGPESSGKQHCLDRALTALGQVHLSQYQVFRQVIEGLLKAHKKARSGTTFGYRIGFQYWKNPGAINRSGLEPNHIGWDRFLAILGTLVQAAFSYQGMELVVIAASETESPRRNISKAVHRVFYRILVFYILGILVIGMLVAYNDTDLLSLQDNNTAAKSPFVIAIKRSGIRVLPHIVNGVIFTSAFSAGNSLLFCSSRVLYGLALRGQAPKFLAYCTKRGLPINAVLFASAFSFLSFMSVSQGSNNVFNWFVNLSTTGGFTSWFVMNVTYIFYRRGLIAQGYDPAANAYHNRLQPYVACWGAGWTLFFILINGFAVFWHFTAQGFLTAYINIPIFFVLYFGYKIVKKTSIWKPLEMDFVTGIPTVEETETEEVPPKNIGEKIAAVIF